MLNNKQILIITPPFTQLSSPYAASPFLAGTLKKQGYAVTQRDLGIELFCRLFSKSGLMRIFSEISKRGLWDEEIMESLAFAHRYVETVEPVISFLQGKNDSLAHRIAARTFLPEGNRFAVLEEEAVTFDPLNIRDKAIYMASLYIDDLTDLLQSTVLPSFSLSRYSDRLAQSPATFDALYHEALEAKDLVSMMLEETLAGIDFSETAAVCITVPFPGTLLGALKIGRYIKKQYPAVCVTFGGGWINTELRDLREPRIFEFCDYITLDDGERPTLAILKKLAGEAVTLVRSYFLEKGKVMFEKGPDALELFGEALGTPDYKGINLSHYIELSETPNPMHRLWSARNFLKLRLAHGCYWHRCAFCDTSLDYISRFEAMPPALVAEQMAELVQKTGISTFHFIDEAIPPALAAQLAEELLKRKLSVSWWGNIRFEKNFTPDLCRLLAASGCIAVSGGLEGVTPRMLELMRKGTTLDEAVSAIASFAEAGILVHSYLIYGFPGQSAQEIIDSLEIVRQLFDFNLITSAYYHRFALTIHSPVFAERAAFGISAADRKNPFANNDIRYMEKAAVPLEMLGEGLKTAIYNYIHGVETGVEVKSFFSGKVPVPSVNRYTIERLLDKRKKKQGGTLLWIGGEPILGEKTENGQLLRLTGLTETVSYDLPVDLANWLNNLCREAAVVVPKVERPVFDVMKETFPDSCGSFAEFYNSELYEDITRIGLLLL